MKTKRKYTALSMLSTIKPAKKIFTQYTVVGIKIFILTNAEIKYKWVKCKLPDSTVKTITKVILLSCLKGRQNTEFYSAYQNPNIKNEISEALKEF